MPAKPKAPPVIVVVDRDALARTAADLRRTAEHHAESCRDAPPSRRINPTAAAKLAAKAAGAIADYLRHTQ